MNELCNNWNESLPNTLNICMLYVYAKVHACFLQGTSRDYGFFFKQWLKYLKKLYVKFFILNKFESLICWEYFKLNNIHH